MIQSVSSQALLAAFGLEFLGAVCSVEKAAAAYRFSTAFGLHPCIAFYFSIREGGAGHAALHIARWSRWLGSPIAQTCREANGFDGLQA